MILSYSTYSCEIPTPQWSYTSDIHLALSQTRNTNDGSVISWDNGVTNDFRVCTSKWMLTQSELDSVHDLITEYSQGRGKDLTLNLGNVGTHSGFFPFGPDKSDYGSYTIAEISNVRSGRLIRPYNRYELEMSFLMRSFPNTVSYTPTNQGTLTIGTVTGLPFVSDVKIDYKKCNRTDITNGGLPAYLNNNQSAAYTDVSWSFETDTANAGLLISYLQTTARGNDITVSTPQNSYMFGAENGSTGTYTVQLTNNIIRISHDGLNKFRFNLSFHLKSRVS